MKYSGGPMDNQTWQTNGWPQQKLPKFGFHTHTTALWPMEQSSILSAKFDCPGACQNISLLATAHDCETDLYGGIATSSRGSFSRGGPWGRGWWNCTFPQILSSAVYHNNLSPYHNTVCVETPLLNNLQERRKEGKINR